MVAIASKTEKFLSGFEELFKRSAKEAEIAYIKPKKSIRGENSVSLIEGDKNKVINPAKKVRKSRKRPKQRRFRGIVLVIKRTITASMTMLVMRNL